MTEEIYNKMLHEIKANYSSCRGVMAKMRSRGKKTPIILCLSRYRNNGEFVPTQGILWENCKCLFRGKLKSKRLFNIVSKFDVCCVEITTAEESERGEAPYICMGDREECPYEECRCKNDEYYAVVEAKYPDWFEEEEEQPNAFNDLFKKLKKEVIGDLRKKVKNESCIPI